MKSKAAIGWYYIGVKDALQKDFAGIPAYEEYRALVEKIFGSKSDWQRREHNEEDKEYYIGVKDALQKDFAGIPAYEEYRALVEKIFGSKSDWQRREHNEEDKDHMFCE